MRRVCVYCGSNPGRVSLYRDAATSLGEVLARSNLELVYGGASKGTMGILADAVLAGGGRVTGIIPSQLVAKEIAHHELSQLEVVDSMHARKARMAELADAFIALPGGYGTLDELAEILTWGQLAMHAKPCGLINVGGYFDHLIAHLDHAQAEGFLKPSHRAMLLTAPTAEALLEAFRDFQVSTETKWSD